MCGGIDGRGEPVRTADDEDQPFGDSVHLLFHPMGKLYRAELLAVFVEQDDRVARLEGFQDQLGLFFLLLLYAQAFGVLQFRDDFQLERGIVACPLHIVTDGGDVMFLYGLSYN